jgi:hypothetical protein
VTWFKVDDQLAFHPKILACTPTAIALWVRAGAWSAGHLTDGALPTHIIRTLGAQRRDAERLVAVGLWERTDSGYQFHDWADWQPTKAQVEQERERTRERVKAHRNARRNAVTPPVTNAVSNGGGTPAPTRPDLKELTTTAPRQRGCRIPDDFAVTDDMREWATANGFGRLDLDQITDEFRDYWEAEAGPKAVKLDWVKTWHNRVREIAKRTTTRPTNGYAQPQPAPAPKILTLAQVRARNDAENLAACRRAAEIDGVAP